MRQKAVWKFQMVSKIDRVIEYYRYQLNPNDFLLFGGLSYISPSLFESELYHECHESGENRADCRRWGAAREVYVRR